MSDSDEDRLVIDLDYEDEELSSSDHQEEEIPPLKSSNEQIRPQVSSEAVIRCQLCEMCLHPDGVDYHMKIHHKMHQNESPNEDPVTSIQYHIIKISVHRQDLENPSNDTPKHPQNLQGPSKDPPKVPLNRFQCEICFKQFHCQRGLSKHFNVHSRKDIPEDLKCKVCGHQSNRKVDFLRHLGTHDKKFNCNVCGRKFAYELLLKGHMKFHENPEELKCKICRCQLASKQALKRHMNKKHSKEIRQAKVFECLICRWIFGDEDDLKFHMKLHGN